MNKNHFKFITYTSASPVSKCTRELDNLQHINVHQKTSKSTIMCLAPIANRSEIGGDGIATGMDAHSSRQRRNGNASTANGSKIGGDGITTSVDTDSLCQTAGPAQMKRQRESNRSSDRHFGHLYVRKCTFISQSLKINAVL